MDNSANQDPNQPTAASTDSSSPPVQPVESSVTGFGADADLPSEPVPLTPSPVDSGRSDLPETNLSPTDSDSNQPLGQSEPISATPSITPDDQTSQSVDVIDSVPAEPIKPDTVKTDLTTPTTPGAPPPPWVADSSADDSDSGQPPGDTPPDKSASAADSPMLKKSIFGKLIPLLGVLALATILIVLAIKFLPGLLKKDGSTKPSTSGKKEATLIYWGLWEPEETMRQIFADYEKENPGIKIIYQQSSHKDYRERLQSALAKKKDDQSAGPDIFRFHSTWLPMLQGSLAPIEHPDINIADYFPVMKKDLVNNNSLYGVPLMYDGLSLYYNVDLFQDAGKQVPTTWEELQQVAKDLTVWDSKNRIQTAGAALGLAVNVDHFADILALMMLQNNADLTKPDECYSIEGSNEETCLAADALTFYTLFSTRDRIWDDTLPNSTYAFATGKVAMIFAPSWRAFEIKNINPELNFKTAPVPQLPDTKVAWATYWAEGIAQLSKNKEAAADLLAYLSKDELLRKIYNAQSQIRLFGEIYPKTELSQDLINDPVVGSFVSQAPYADSWYMATDTHDNGLNDKIIKYYENAITAIVEDGEVASEILPTIAQGVAQVLSTYRIAVN